MFASIIHSTYTIFADRAAAEAIASTLEDTPHEIREDPKGSGRCLIALFDEDEPTHFVTYL